MRRLCFWPVYGMLALLIVLPAAGCALNQGRVSEDFHTTLAVAPAAITVHNAVGGIDVKAWDKPGVEIDAHKRGSSLDDVRAITISVQPSGSTLVVTSHFPATSSNCAVEYTIYAPAHTNLDLDESIGGIRSSGFTGDVHETTSTGAIAASMAAAGGTQHIDLNVSVGAIELTIPPESSARISAATSIGAIKADFPLSHSGNFLSSSAKGSIGNGDARIELTTATGAIAIRRE
ncbi:MAG TPA: DUF4097 family beta strand repeat-containing protein [Alphaproteobacteria bacterium]|nr:DUF4097 family beta strand repeat-containing protein [Alphaproteobacteria bacterium]